MDSKVVSFAQIERRAPAGHWYILLLLALANTANLCDRNIFSVLLQPIKREFRLSDSALALLTGLPFAALYLSCGIPLALLADRSSRRNIIATALLGFSAMTVVCAGAATFAQLFLARMGVAIGEAGCTPTASSMISDLCPPTYRARGMSVYAIGANLGLLAGMLLGGWISQYWGWRAALLAAGVPGLIIAALFFLTVREPARGRFDNPTSATERSSLPEVVRCILARPSLRHLVTGSAVIAIPTFGLMNWSAAYLARSFDMKPAAIGTVLAVVLGVLSGIGVYGYAALFDRLKAANLEWQARLPALGCVGVFPVTLALYLAPTASAAVALMVLPAVFLMAWTPAVFAVAHDLVRPSMRSTISAIILTLMVFVGQGVGGQLVGALSDLFAHWGAGKESLRYALLSISPFMPVAGLCFWLSSRSLIRDLEPARSGSLVIADSVV
jgi:predicted MFS family arabinose efflux permease